MCAYTHLDVIILFLHKVGDIVFTKELLKKN